jgi:hypothetical protein
MVVAIIHLFLFGCVIAKKATITSYRRLLLWRCCKEEEEDNNFRHLLQWLCRKKWQH